MSDLCRAFLLKIFTGVFTRRINFTPFYYQPISKFLKHNKTLKKQSILLYNYSLPLRSEKENQWTEIPLNEFKYTSCTIVCFFCAYRYGSWFLYMGMPGWYQGKESRVNSYLTNGRNYRGNFLFCPIFLGLLGLPFLQRIRVSTATKYYYLRNIIPPPHCFRFLLVSFRFVLFLFFFSYFTHTALRELWEFVFRI